jgi:hypothetical protein
MMLLGAVIISIMVINNLVFQKARSPQHIGTAQMIYGWARLYKPMLFDGVKPELVAFGYSWVRDLFDPPRMQALTGMKFFNFGMSGATSFESLRLIQNMLAVHPPKAVLLNLQSFYDTPRDQLTESQFDERILHVNRDGSPNSWANLYRVLKINTSGAALAFNYRFLSSVQAMNTGKSREEVLGPYERRDWAESPKLIAEARNLISTPRIFGSDADPAIRGELSFNDLDAAMGQLCQAGVDIKLYESPAMCGYDMRQTFAALQLVRKHQASCQSKISFHVFRYPNAVTMEGLAKNPGLSMFYRPDGHPRPTMGEVIVTRMFGLENKSGAPPLPTDFGADVAAMSEDDANSWISSRAKRCYGQWEPGSLDLTMVELDRIRGAWSDLYGIGSQK